MELKYDLPIDVAQSVTDAALSDAILFGVDSKLLGKILNGLTSLFKSLRSHRLKVRLHPAWCVKHCLAWSHLHFVLSNRSYL